MPQEQALSPNKTEGFKRLKNGTAMVLGRFVAGVGGVVGAAEVLKAIDVEFMPQRPEMGTLIASAGAIIVGSVAYAIGKKNI